MQHRRHQRGHAPDYQLVVAVSLLLSLGMIVIYSISPALSYRLLGTVGENYFLMRQGLHTILALIVFAIIIKIPYQRWSEYLTPLVWATAGALLLLQIPFFSITEKGATRWIGFGPVSFQPSELLKFSLAIYLAQLLARAHKNGKLNSWDDTFVPIAVVFGVLGLMVVVMQKDMGTMLVVSAILIGMYFLSGAQARHVGYLVGGTLGAGLLATLLAPHRMSRLLTFLDSSSDVEGAGYHINQALIAIGSGGVSGLGLGRSVQVYGYLPEAANDSIFAIVAEKFGFIGAIAVLALFAYLLYRIYLVVRDAPDMFGRLLAGGLFIWIASHVIINIGAMLSLIPLTGLTLPFLSYGGSSLIFIMVGLGVVFNISRYTQKSEGGSYAYRTERRRNSRTYYATARRST